jgi:RecT family
VSEQQQETALAPAQPATMALRADVIMGTSPTTLDQAIALATVMAKSTLIPKDFQNQPANIVIAVQLGAELGLAPMQSLQSIAVINGRPSVWGDGLLGLCLRSGLLENIDEAEIGEDLVGTCTVQRKGWTHAVTRSFSKKDAEKAGLWGKAGPWQTYPKRMLQMRARTFALRDVFADVLRGLTSIEEARDILMPFDEVTGEILECRPAVQARVIEMPKAKATDPEPKPDAGETKPPKAGTKPPKAETTHAAATSPAATPAASQPTQPNGGSAPAKPAATQAPPAASSVPAQAGSQAVYHVASVEKKTNEKGRHCYLVQTKEGPLLHTWSTTAASDAMEAREDGRAVRFETRPTTFARAPLYIDTVIATERIPGEDG